MGLVEGRADEVVHAGVGYYEGFGFVGGGGGVFLDVEDGGKERTGLGEEEAARFEQQMEV